MFSAKGPVCLTFGDENDCYYTEDLLQLDLQQYLWMCLHSENYAAVYFLRKKNDDFEITTFGDTDRQLPTNGFLWKNTTNILTAQRFWEQMLKWTRQGAAVVCPLNDFCQVVEHAGMLRRPSEELNRKGIFVLTASIYAEQNAKSLLQSSAFSEERLNFKPLLEVRCASEQGLYESLSERNCCVFLNTPMRENLRPILQRILLEHPDRMAACPDLNRMADQLACCLREPAPGQGLKKLCALGSPVRYASFRDIYRCLQDLTEWNDLLAISKQEPLREEAHAAENILRAPDGWAARCLALRMPKEAALDTMLRNYAEEGLKQIRRLAASPRNRMENPEVTREISRFLAEIPKAESSGDGNSRCWLIYSIAVCLPRVCAEQEGETQALLKVVEILKCVYEILGQYSAAKRDLRMYSYSVGGTSTEETLPVDTVLSIQKLQLQKLQAAVLATEDTLKRCIDLAYGAVINLSNWNYHQLQDVLQSVQNLEQDLVKQEQKAEAEPPVLEKQPGPGKPETPQPEDDEDEYEIRMEDLYMPKF